jgi:hypothetical protein
MFQDTIWYQVPLVYWKQYRTGSEKCIHIMEAVRLPSYSWPGGVE